MKAKLLFLLFFSLFFSTLCVGQHTFEDKKHDKKQTNVPPSVTVNFQKNKTTTSKVQVLSGRTNFQMPSVFQRNSGDASYEHISIKNVENGASFFIESVANEFTKKTMARQDDEAIAAAYLTEIRPLLQVSNPNNDFILTQKNTDNLGQTHLKMQQTFKGIKVYGAEIIVHIDKKKSEIGANSSQLKNIEVSEVTAKINQQKAIAIIEGDLGRKIPNFNVSNSLLQLPEPTEELIFYSINEKNILSLHVTVHANIKDRWEYFINANTGEILDKYYHTCTMFHDFEDNTRDNVTEVLAPIAPPTTGTGKDLNGINRSISTYNHNGTNYLINTTKPMFNAGQSQFPDNTVGTLITIDLNNKPLTNNANFYHVTNSSNTWNNPTGISAHYNADVAYEYFKNKFNRNSINGQGGNIISIINVADPDNGEALDNAFWNGAAMFYGNGKVGFKPLAGSLDVGGHEMSHGVIQNTANLEYRNQSGALNESFADVFGVLIDRDDWTLGEDIVKSQYFPSGALRSMQNPNNGTTRGNNGWQPKDMNEFVTTQEDNGGVHVNSGIPNRAFYLFATAIGKDKAEQIYYRTLTTYLTVSSQFIDLRLGVIKAATDIHGANSAEVQAAKTAFDTVGITDGAATDTTNDIPVASGSDFILSVDVDPTNNNTLYISDTNGSNFVALTTTKLYRKPSVADDGSLAIFVTENKTINAITLDPNNIEETVISNDPHWTSISLSKDGNRLAAVRDDADGIIYIFDLEKSTNKAFELYNPTTAEGVSTGEVLYADALEWDYSGQYLIYDALNELNNANGSKINYWDVGAIEVYNNQTKNFGGGAIQKIFTNLPKGVSIGNPTFSKTSGNILAFDYFDEINNTYEVITANIETGIVKTVYNNNKLGFPNYSKNDTKLLFDSNNNNKEVIGVINLASDKLSPQGNATELIPDAIWGIWYTVGQRATVSSAKEITDFRFNSTSPVSIGVITGNTIKVTVPSTVNRQNLIATFTNSAKSQVYVANQLQQSGATTNNFTSAINYTVVAEDGSTKVFVVTVSASTTGNPNDSDNDGVPNNLDQCPNTPIGTIVDTSGCPKFSLPSTNFRISTSGETCIDNNNGSLSISAEQNLNYTVTLVGNGLNQVKSFNTTTNFNNLPPGVYNLCFTVQGQNGYKLCYDVVIAQAEPLSVTGKVDSSLTFITLQLNGATQYYVTFNDKLFTTTSSSLKLDITSLQNTLIVKTDKDCQGVYEEEFIIDKGIQIFPNPISDGNLHIVIPNYDAQLATVQISNLSGQIIVSKAVIPINGQLNFDVTYLNTGVYIVHVDEGKNTWTQKIIVKK